MLAPALGIVIHGEHVVCRLSRLAPAER